MSTRVVGHHPTAYNIRPNRVYLFLEQVLLAQTVKYYMYVRLISHYKATNNYSIKQTILDFFKIYCWIMAMQT